MQSSCDQNCDSFPADARPVKAIKQGWERQGVWRWAGDVADHDGHRLFASGEVTNGSRCQRMIESLL